MVLCVGYMGRLGATGLRTSRPFLGSSQFRSLSTIGLQRSKGIISHSELRNLQFRSGPRSFWSWSKSTPTPSAATSPAPVQQPAPAEISATTPDVPIPPEASTSLDAAPTLDASITVAQASETISSTELAASLPPLNYGDLAALDLAGWTPAGLCRWTMEVITVSSGLPWFWTIVATTVLSRVVLFPFTVKQMQSTAALAPHQAEIQAIRDDMATAQKKQDMLAMQRAALRQKVIYEKAGVSVAGMAVAPFIQLPVTLGMFFGVKKLCDLPLEQLKWSGVEWLPDLTIADPTWTLPILATVLMNAQLSVTMRDLVGSTPQMGHVMNLLRILTTGSVFLLANLPNGVLVYLITSIITMTGQSLLLRQPAIRTLLGIPLIPEKLRTPPPTMRESAQYLRQWWRGKLAEARAADRAARRP